MERLRDRGEPADRNEATHREFHRVMLCFIVFLVATFVLVRAQRTAFSAGEQPMLRISQPGVWPGSWNNSDHSIPDYYHTSFAENSILKKRTSPFVGDRTSGGFGATLGNGGELAKALMVQLGSFTPALTPGDAQRLVETYRSQIKDTRGAPVPLLESELSFVAQDATMAKILETFFKEDKGVFVNVSSFSQQVGADTGGIYQFSRDPLTIETLANGQPDAPAEEFAWFHELLHYFFDKTDSVSSVSDIRNELVVGSDHSVIYPIVRRFQLTNGIRQQYVGVRGILESKNDLPGFTAGGPERTGGKIVAYLDAMKEYQDKGMRKEFLKERQDLKSYMTGRFYSEFVDTSMQVALQNDKLAGIERSDAYYQDLAFLWGYYAVIFREMIVLSIAIQDTPCGLGQTSGQPRYLDQIPNTPVFAELYMLFIGQFNAELLSQDDISLDTASKKVMLSKVFAEALVKCPGCAALR